MPDPTQRFSSRVEPYAKYRPDYPRGIVDLLVDRCALRPGEVIADVGSGTGKLSELFVDHGYRVIGVEPNGEMRRVAERLLGDRALFSSVNGRAEATTLEAGSVDLVAVAQAFHWFDPEPTRRELARILRPAGRIAVIWNARRSSHSAFMQDYERLLCKHGSDYDHVRSHSLDEEARRSLFGPGGGDRVLLRHNQSLDLEGLEGRVASASYMPEPGDPGHPAMIHELRALFETHHAEGRVRIEYDTLVYCGRAAIRSDTP